MMRYLPLLILLIPAIWFPVAVGVVCADLWRHELSRWSIPIRLMAILLIGDCIIILITILVVIVIGTLRRSQ